MPQYANEVPVLDVADKIGAHPPRSISKACSRAERRTQALDGPACSVVGGVAIDVSGDGDRTVADQIREGLDVDP